MKFCKAFSLFAFALLLFPSIGISQETKVGNVDPNHAQVLVESGAILIDVRERSEVSELAYDIDNAINIPLGELESRLGEIPKGKPLVMACRSGGRSAEAAAILQKNGYSNLVNLEGGIIEWQAKKLPVLKKGATTGKACCSKKDRKKCKSKASCKSEKSAKKCCSGGKASKKCGSKSKAGLRR